MRNVSTIINRFLVCRENDQIIGSYLVIQNVALDDYGEYRCEISNGADEDKITLPAHVYRQGSRLSRSSSLSLR
jgi:hypothetical protein